MFCIAAPGCPRVQGCPPALESISQPLFAVFCNECAQKTRLSRVFTAVRTIRVVKVLGLVCYARELSVSWEWPRLAALPALGCEGRPVSGTRRAAIKSRAQQKYSAVSADAAHCEPYAKFRRETPVAASKIQKAGDRLLSLRDAATHRWMRHPGRALRVHSGMLALSRSCGSAQFAAQLGRRRPRGTRRL